MIIRLHEICHTYFLIMKEESRLWKISITFVFNGNFAQGEKDIFLVNHSLSNINKANNIKNRRERKKKSHTTFPQPLDPIIAQEDVSTSDITPKLSYNARKKLRKKSLPSTNSTNSNKMILKIISHKNR